MWFCGNICACACVFICGYVCLCVVCLCVWLYACAIIYVVGLCGCAYGVWLGMSECVCTFISRYKYSRAHAYISSSFSPLQELVNNLSHLSVEHDLLTQGPSGPQGNAYILISYIYSSSRSYVIIHLTGVSQGPCKERLYITWYMCFLHHGSISNNWYISAIHSRLTVDGVWMVYWWFIDGLSKG